MAAGPVRVLEWPGDGDGVAVFLHGLSAVADVWQATVTALGRGAPTCIAFDQRGHGHAPRGAIDYRVGAFVDDLLSIIGSLRLERPHLVGHSMGGRVAMVAAARHRATFRSVTVVDIGPEQWKANAEATAAALEAMPAAFADTSAAEAFAARGRALQEPWRSAFFARLERGRDGRYRWLADPADLARIVRVHRARNYWRDWGRIRIPALLVRGERSNELRPRIAAAMQRRNPHAEVVELSRAPHNIPLAAPVFLAEALMAFWQRPASRCGA